MYSIKQASIRSGVSVPLIRAWERRYGVVSPKRTASGYRLYDDQAIATLMRVRELTDRPFGVNLRTDSADVGERVDHLIRLREQQDESGGFLAFIPLAFHPANTKFAHLPGPDLVTKLKVVALSRLMLDNIPHIKAYWIMMTPRIAQVAQRFGANDIDGTVVEEKIYHDAGATTSQSLRRGELLELIRKAG